MSKRKITRTIDMRTLCLTTNPDMYSEETVVYEFSNGRRFTIAPGEEYDNFPTDTDGADE